MVKVKRRPNESPDQLLKRFRKSVVKSRIMSDVRRKPWHVSRKELRRIKRKKAIRRMQRRHRRLNGYYRRGATSLRGSEIDSIRGVQWIV